MISTVTTTTVTTVAVGSSFVIIGVLVLLGLLIQKELTTASANDRIKLFGKILNIGIFPLLIAFIMFVVAKVVDVIK
jgi:hypothetical protein